MRSLRGCLLLLVACSGDKPEAVHSAVAEDSGIDCDPSPKKLSCNGTPAITDWGYTCDGATPETCTGWVEADQPMGMVRIVLVETGDSGFICGPKGGVNDCGVWEESHSAFRSTGQGCSGSVCGERRELSLTVEDHPENQVDNHSTLFGSDLLKEGRVTVLLQIAAPSGAAADCDRSGHDPYYFFADCPY